MKNKIFSYAISSIILLGTFLLSSCAKHPILAMAREDSAATFETTGRYINADGGCGEVIRNPKLQQLVEEEPRSIRTEFDRELLLLGRLLDNLKKNPTSVTSQEYQEVIKEAADAVSGSLSRVQTCSNQKAVLSVSNENLTGNLTNVTQRRDRCIEDTKELNEEKRVLAQNNIAQSQENELLTSQVEALNTTKTKLEGALNNKTRDLTQCENITNELNQNLTSMQESLRHSTLLNDGYLKMISLQNVTSMQESLRHSTLLNDGFLLELKSPPLLWGYPVERVAMGGVVGGTALLGSVAVLTWKLWSCNKALEAGENNIVKLTDTVSYLRGQIDGFNEMASLTKSTHSRDNKTLRATQSVKSGSASRISPVTLNGETN
jgi:hypothetical protein